LERTLKLLRVAGAELVAVSFLVLFSELTLIRWLATQVRVLAYFPNLVLISSFLGLGVGCLAARYSNRLLPVWPVAMLVVVAVANSMSAIAFTQESVSEHLWLLYYDLPQDAPVVHGVRLPIIAMFILCAAAFVPLGAFVADRLQRFREAQRPLTGYACDLAGSLLGTVAFGIASALHAGPPVWFMVTIVMTIALVSRSITRFAVAAAALAAVLVLVIWSERADAYSPYYALRRVDLTDNRGFLILANGSQHQYAAPLRNSDVLTTDDGRLLRDGYHLPYRLLRNKPQRVLVIGAGSGNDVAVALDEGARHVDAVEIDPVIVQMGRAAHPDRPYADPRVRVITTDARSFLNNSRAQYDLIIYGTVDSMTRLSALSNVRLDNFIYTRECFEAAQRRLAPGGGIAVYYGTSVDYIDARLRGILHAVTGRPPQLVPKNFGSFNRLYLAGEAFAHLPPSQPPAPQILPSDNWPYIYLRSRAITAFYLSVMAAIIAISAASVFGVLRTASIRDFRFDSPMFFFGVAFLLLETKAVTEMNLVWGATWITSAVVFGSVLAMVLAGTILMAWRPLSWRVATAGLVVSLIVNFLIPVQALLATGFAARLAGSALFVGIPIFFASVCFALQFRGAEEAHRAFGWNLIGAVAGGLLEFTSMIVGLKLLSLVALASYLAAFATTPSVRRTEQ
jgi:spermidine synthase